MICDYIEAHKDRFGIETPDPRNGSSAGAWPAHAAAAWVHWFNTERLHSAIGYHPPVEFEDLYRDTTATPVLEVA